MHAKNVEDLVKKITTFTGSKLPQLNELYFESAGVPAEECAGLVARISQLCGSGGKSKSRPGPQTFVPGEADDAKDNAQQDTTMDATKTVVRSEVQEELGQKVSK